MTSSIDRSPAAMKVRLEVVRLLRKELEADQAELRNLKVDEITMEHIELFRKLEEVLGK